MSLPRKLWLVKIFWIIFDGIYCQLCFHCQEWIPLINYYTGLIFPTMKMLHSAFVLPSNDSARNETTDFYPILLENNIYRISCLALGILTFMIGLPFIYSVIWFEKFGSDKKRTVLNLLVSKINYVLIMYMCFIQVPELMRYTHGPLPVFICYWQHISRSICILMILLFADAITTIRFAFIFWLKNPAAFHDDFWCRFISFWIFGFSLILCCTWHYLLRVQSSGFYICTGWQVSKESLNSPGVANGFLIILSVILNILVYLKIYTYKKKQTALTLPSGCVAKSVVLKDIEEQSLSNFAAILIGIIFIAISLANSFKLNSVTASNFNIYPNYLYAYFRSFVMPILALIILMILFAGKKNYRKTISIELKELFWIKFWNFNQYDCECDLPYRVVEADLFLRTKNRKQM